MKEQPTTNVFLAGVGGQGIVLASRILCELAFAAGCDVKQNEVHGLSQRGGSVTGHVRWGGNVFSPVIMEGEAHYLYALEELEALRWAHILSPGGTILVNRQRILPSSVTLDGATYPQDIMERLAEYGRVVAVPAYDIAKELKNSRVANIVLLGAMSVCLDNFTLANWRAAVTARVPAKYRELNLTAFERGRAAVSRNTG